MGKDKIPIWLQSCAARRFNTRNSLFEFGLDI
jgi:hypothetical protein